MFFSETLHGQQIRLQETFYSILFFFHSLHLSHTFPFLMNTSVLLFVSPICHYSVLMVILDTLIPYLLEIEPNFPLQIIQLLVRPPFASFLLFLLLVFFHLLCAID